MCAYVCHVYVCQPEYSLQELCLSFILLRQGLFVSASCVLQAVWPVMSFQVTLPFLSSILKCACWDYSCLHHIWLFMWSLGTELRHQACWTSAFSWWAVSPAYTWFLRIFRKKHFMTGNRNIKSVLTLNLPLLAMLFLLGKALARTTEPQFPAFSVERRSYWSVMAVTSLKTWKGLLVGTTVLDKTEKRNLGMGFTPIILALGEAEAGGLCIQCQLGIHGETISKA